MLFPIELPPWLVALNEDARELGRSFKKDFETLGRRETFAPQSELAPILGDQLVYIEEGRIDRSIGHKLLRFHGEGDVLAGTDTRSSLRSEFSSRCLLCPREAWIKGMARDPQRMQAWLEYNELQQRITNGLLAVLAPDDGNVNALIHRFSAGDNIITQGTPSTSIFVMIMGQAIVLRDNVAVGKIAGLEIFGEMGCFTEKPRTSTVRAMTDCTIQVVSLPEFGRLLKTRPSLVTELVRTLCLRLDLVNERLSLEPRQARRATAV